jgi:hypothetical protein
MTDPVAHGLILAETMKNPSQKALGSRNRKKSDQLDVEVLWSDYPRIEPDTYTAYSRSARWYLDPNFKRWVCLVVFEVLSLDTAHFIARIPLFLNGGNEPLPRAGRRSRFWTEWMRAAGRTPRRGDRLSLKVFTRRMARVAVRDTEGESPYSVVDEILFWETGPSDGSICQQVTQSSRHT